MDDGNDIFKECIIKEKVPFIIDHNIDTPPLPWVMENCNDAKPLDPYGNADYARMNALLPLIVGNDPAEDGIEMAPNWWVITVLFIVIVCLLISACTLSWRYWERAKIEIMEKDRQRNTQLEKWYLDEAECAYEMLRKREPKKQH